MVIFAHCGLLGASLAAAVTSPHFASPSSSSLSATRPRVVRVRASSSSLPVESSTAATSSTPPFEASTAATSFTPPVESSGASTSSVALETVPEPESASISSLEIPSAAPATSKSLVSRTPQLVVSEGAAGLALVNHYRILKVPYGSSSGQIFQAYKDRVEEVKSQEKELEEEAARDQLDALQVSYDTLNSEEERKVYDWVLQSFENRLNNSYIWPYQTDITQRYTDKERPPLMRSFDQEGNNRLGLFLIGWVVISIIFGATMKSWIPYRHFRDL